MKNRTFAMFVDCIQQDFAWRIKELDIIKSEIPQDENDKQSAFIRAGIALLYAHWEGFVKSAAENYIDYVSYRGLKYKDLQHCFSALGLRRNVNLLASAKKIILKTVLIDELVKSFECAADKLTNTIDTKSNLNSEIFEEICYIVGLDFKNYELKKNFIDIDLLKKRNSIAHGNYIEIEDKSFYRIYEITIELLSHIKDEIIDSARQERFKKRHE
jgi:hypothetical protein